MTALIADAVQEAVAELHARMRAGEALPKTSDEILELVVARAQRRRKSWLKRAREQSRNLQLIAPTMSTRELFDVICARDEQMKFFVRLYDALGDEPEARVLLFVVLEKGILFHETRLLAEELHTSSARVTSLKGRIIRRGRRIMAELTGADRQGGNT
jgi:hypothetical protein